MSAFWWGLWLMIGAALVVLNTWNYKRRAAMTPDQRKADDTANDNESRQW